MKHTHFRQTTLATIRVRTIYSLVLRFCQLHPLPKRRGRPCKYSEALILTLWLLAVRENASYRRLLFALAPEILPDHPLPALGTLAYRLQHLADKRLQQLLHWLAQQGMASETLTCETPCVFVDGTGVGYASPFFAQYLRGAQIRQQRSHVKVVALVYWQGGRAWVIGLSCGAAYADEGRLLGEWVERYGRGGLGSGTLLVGDRLYGYRARLLKQLEEAGWLPVARVEAGLHQQVRADARLRARLRAEVYGWALGERYRIEQVFGSVKSAYGSVWRARSWEGARVWVWGMFVLWNMVGLVRVLGDGSDGFIVCCVWVRGGWVIFRTPSKRVDKSARLCHTNNSCASVGGYPNEDYSTLGNAYL
ncbi:MAG: hypothetical protein KatS3mg023_0312 [Armatimonadota bacterium]|nr:MAG: hypothetical protein KatS3mg023_0312 [Armatimonadota bacterium]